MVDFRNAITEDCELLFKWANEESVRKNSVISDKIELDNHIKWFNNKMNDKNCKMLIITKDNIDVGQIRIDILNNVGIISYSIDKMFRGQGIGTEALKLIKLKLNNINLVGVVKKENKSSTKAFENAGYKRIDKDDYIEFTSK